MVHFQRYLWEGCQVSSSVIFVPGYNFFVSNSVALDDKNDFESPVVKFRVPWLWASGSWHFFLSIFLADFSIVSLPFAFSSGDFPVIGIKTARYYSAILRYTVVWTNLFETMEMHYGHYGQYSTCISKKLLVTSLVKLDSWLVKLVGHEPLVAGLVLWLGTCLHSTPPPPPPLHMSTYTLEQTIHTCRNSQIHGALNEYTS